MGLVEQEVFVEAPPARIFAYLSPALVGAWYAPANGTRVEVVDGEVRAGATLRIRGESRYGPSAYEAVVTAWDPPRAFGWRSTVGAPPQEVTVRLEPDGGGTRVRLRDRYRSRGFLGLRALLDRVFVRPRVVAVDREAVENLKALAEGRRGCA